MSENEKGRGYTKKKFISKDIPNNVGRSFFNSRNTSHKIVGEDEENKIEIKIKQPTILQKTREQHDETVSSPKRIPKESESTSTIPGINSSNTEAHSMPKIKCMYKSIKFLEDGILMSENLQEYLSENNDFSVIGIVGQQGVGKSTIINLLANKKVDKETINKLLLKKKMEETLPCKFSNMNISEVQEEKEIFKIQNVDDIENNRNKTNGIDVYITENRTIFLDCQPFISMSIMDELVENENKRSNLVSEFIPSENSGEIQSLQITSFLMSICHIILLVQDWFFDSNVCRFIQTAEMLKPTISNPEDELSEHFPHLFLIHNRATVDDFSVQRFKTIQSIYRNIFFKSKLILESNLGISSGRIVKHLNPENCGPILSIFLIPEYIEEESGMFQYRGHPSMTELIEKLRTYIFGTSKHSLTHVQLTEKTWLIYCSKVWETVRKSSFFVEYTKLLP